MGIGPQARRVLRPLSMRVYGALRPLLVRTGLDTRAKYAYETWYWRRRHAQERTLGNDWYEALFTSAVGLTREDYRDRAVLDVGCGPRGSLEWADHTARRVGLDPLVPAYRELGIDRHAMEYVAAPAERMPFPDDTFDIVTTLNSLDHVDDVDRSIAEIARVVAPGGMVVVVVEVAHEPTVAEPHRLDWDLAQRFAPWFDVELEQQLEFDPAKPGAAASLRHARPFDHDDPRDRSGTLHLQLRRR